MSYETVEVPFQTWGNRQVLTAKQAVEQPWIRSFIERWPACFEYDARFDAWLFYPDGDAPPPRT